MTRIALITGGSRGLGRNTALKLAREGCGIVLTYHTRREDADGVVGGGFALAFFGNVVAVRAQKVRDLADVWIAAQQDAAGERLLADL